MERLNRDFANLSLTKPEIPCTPVKSDSEPPCSHTGYENKENCDLNKMFVEGAAAFLREAMSSGNESEHNLAQSTPTVTGLFEETLEICSDSSLLLDESGCEATKLKTREPDKIIQKVKTSPDDPFQLGIESKPRKSMGISKAIPQHVPTALLVDISPQSNTWAEKLPTPEGVMTRSRAKQMAASNQAAESPLIRNEISKKMRNEQNNAPSKQTTENILPNNDGSNSVIKIEENSLPLAVNKAALTTSYSTATGQSIPATVCPFSALNEHSEAESSTDTVTSETDKQLNTVDDKAVHYEFAQTHLVTISRPTKQPVVGVVRPLPTVQVEEPTQVCVVETPTPQQLSVDDAAQRDVSTETRHPMTSKSHSKTSTSSSRQIGQAETNVGRRQTRRSTQPNTVSIDQSKSNTKVSAVTARRKSMALAAESQCSSSLSGSSRLTNKRQSLSTNVTPKPPTSITNSKISSVTAKRLGIRIQSQLINQPDQHKPELNPATRRNLATSDFKPPSGATKRTTRNSSVHTDVKPPIRPQQIVPSTSSRPPTGTVTQRPVTRKSMAVSEMKPHVVPTDPVSKTGAMVKRKSLLPPRLQPNSENSKTEAPYLKPNTASTPNITTKRRSITPRHQVAGSSSNHTNNPSSKAVGRARRLSSSLPR